MREGVPSQSEKPGRKLLQIWELPVGAGNGKSQQDSEAKRTVRNQMPLRWLKTKPAVRNQETQQASEPLNVRFGVRTRMGLTLRDLLSGERFFLQFSGSDLGGDPSGERRWEQRSAWEGMES